MNILEALSALDTDNDDDWTKDGLPKTDAVSEVVGEKVTREQITEVAPLFTRENPVLEVEDQAPATPADPGTDPDAEDDASDDQTSTDEDGDGTGDDAADDDASNDDEDDDQENIADESDAPAILPGRLGKAHPEVMETAAALEKAQKELKAANEAVAAANKAHSAAVQKHTPLTHTAKENQIGIMGIIDAGMKRKEAKFKEAKAVNAALTAVANPIDKANAKPEHRGHGNLHNHAPAGKTE
jgi:hypothetical protein